MIRIAGALLLASACLAPVRGQDKPAAPASTSDAVKQLEHDWGDAEKAADTDNLSAILADDWVGLGPDGATQTKKEFLDNLKSGVMKVESVEFGPMHVKVIGTVAIVQGSDTEKSSMKGKDTSGKSVWMDVFAKRDGKWQAVRSQTATVK